MRNLPGSFIIVKRGGQQYVKQGMEQCRWGAQ